MIVNATKRAFGASVLVALIGMCFANTSYAETTTFTVLRLNLETLDEHRLAGLRTQINGSDRPVSGTGVINLSLPAERQLALRHSTNDVRRRELVFLEELSEFQRKTCANRYVFLYGPTSTTVSRNWGRVRARLLDAGCSVHDKNFSWINGAIDFMNVKEVDEIEWHFVRATVLRNACVILGYEDACTSAIATANTFTYAPTELDQRRISRNFADDVKRDATQTKLMASVLAAKSRERARQYLEGTKLVEAVLQECTTAGNYCTLPGLKVEDLRSQLVVLYTRAGEAAFTTDKPQACQAYVKAIAHLDAIIAVSRDKKAPADLQTFRPVLRQTTEQCAVT